LGIIPDESPKKPGEYGPYIQSGKFNKFKEAGEELVKQGKAYYCFCTSEELEESRKIAEENHQTPKYNRKCLKLSESEIAEKINANVSHAIRLKMPDNGNIE
jgi:glutamyl-tRNA synthetase